MDAPERASGQRRRLADDRAVVVLERLSPLERAAFLLHDVFGYSHAEVAAMVDRSPAAVRKVAERARGHLAEQRPRYEPDTGRRDAVTQAFIAAVAGADLDDLMDLLAPDITFVADGGGVVPAVGRPLHGADRVARTIVSLARRRPADWTFAVGEFNGEPGIVIRRSDGTVDSLWVLHVTGRRIAGISVIRAPDKLRAIPPSAAGPREPGEPDPRPTARDRGSGRSRQTRMRSRS